MQIMYVHRGNDCILPLFMFLTNMFVILGLRSLLLSIQPMQWWPRWYITFYLLSFDDFFLNFRTEESSTISSANDGQDEGDETDDDEDLQNLIEESSADFERKSIRRNVNWQDLKLPDTCTMLTTNQGARIFIIGTAHFSRFVLKNL